jgi:PPOX class probable F420-dependent enzyme
VHRVGHLATADAQGTPHVIPVCYARVDDRLYFVVDDKPKRPGTTLKRLRNIASNARCAVVIDDYDEDWGRLAYLLMHCAATVVTSQEEYDTALTALRARYAPYRRMPLHAVTHPMVRMEIQRWHFWRASGRSP